jgi:hypothetical protein
MSLRIRHIPRKAAREAVARWHSHHRAHVGDILCLGAFVGGALVAVEVLGRPSAVVADDGETWEITRQACGPDAPRYTSSRLHGAATRVALAAGCTLVITYTRADERGSSCLAANFRPVSMTTGRPWTSGNKTGRWLPGFYEPSTEIVDRVRWEYGPRAGAVGCAWDGARWNAMREAA